MKRLALRLLLLLASYQAYAADYALLIGVSDYPNLPRRLWLRAPGNDVALMRELLVERGFSPDNIRQLVSRVGGDKEPTRRNIMEAMGGLQAQVQRGDRIVFYLAGHGSQQPQPADRGKRPAEPDGLDEVFLPADVHRWDGAGSAAAIPNALLDDEIGEWIDAIVDRGATVWAIFDTCHAAGMARGPAGSVARAGRERAVSPADLGLPTKAPRVEAATTGLAAAGSATGRTDGRMLAFAGRTHESTVEEWMPAGARLGQNRLHGIFTYHLVQAFRLADASTLEGLEREVLQAYAREKRAAPTPLFFGDRTLSLR